MVVPDAPARALVIIGDGLMQSLSPSHLHLHALAESGACGFLAFRHLPSHLDTASRALFEMRQLLDVHDSCYSSKSTDGARENFGGGTDVDFNIPSIAERFMGMKAALITNSEPIANLGKSLGLTLSNSRVELGFSTCAAASQLPASSSVASHLVEMLGLSPSSQVANSCELVLLHLGTMDGDNTGGVDLTWIDAVVGEVKALMKSGTKAYDHIYLSVVLGYGSEAALRATSGDDEFPSLELSDQLPSNLRALRPLQTYKMKGGKPVEDVRDHHPWLVVHQMDGVTRRDHATNFSFQEFKKNGSSLMILADRFLHEIAFKLWKAPKYGA